MTIEVTHADEVCESKLFQRCRSSVSRSEEHTSELQSIRHLVCRLLLEKKKHLAVDTDMRLDQALAAPPRTWLVIDELTHVQRELFALERLRDRHATDLVATQAVEEMH